MSGKPLHKAIGLWILLAGLAGACAPTHPDAPAEGYTLVPRAFAARLPAADWHAALQRLLRASGAATARQATVEVGGTLTMAQQFALTSEIRASMPTAAVTFQPGSDGAPLVTVRYAEAIPNRCLAEDAWVEEGFLPAGCAAALTLSRMVSDPRELTVGTPMGPAPLAPLARDAIRSLDDNADHSAAAASAGQSGQTSAAGGPGSTTGAAP